MLNRRDRNLAGYAQTKAICNALFDVHKRAFWKEVYASPESVQKSLKLDHNALNALSRQKMR